MKYFFYLILLLSVQIVAAQTPGDTVIAKQPVIKKIKPVVVKKDTGILRIQAPKDSLGEKKDSVVIPAITLFNNKIDLSYSGIIKINAYYSFFGVPENRVTEERKGAGKDALFYIVAGLLFFFALVKLLFNKYVTNLLGLVFRVSLRQKQIREQLLQTPMPSLLLNIFFVVVAGLYIYFLLRHYNIGNQASLWLLLLYCVVAVGLVYLIKFVVLKLTGWIFNMRDAADTYIFIVFLVNKLLAIFLLPLLIVMLFSRSSWASVLLTLSYIMVVGFFAYRYLVSFAPVRREVKVSQFHFFMYLCAFEIIPMLLIYKVLVHFF